MKFLHSGFRSQSFLTEDENILLVGQNAASYDSYKAMAWILRKLEGQLSTVRVPQQLRLIPPNNTYSFGALQYTYIPGSVLTESALRHANMKNIAARLGMFLRELHTIPLTDIAPKFDPSRYLAEQRAILARNIQALKNHISAHQLEALTRWQQAFETYLQQNHTFCLVHGDLWYENYILTSDYKNLIGIVDWENAHISDPAEDFCALTYLGNDFVKDVLTSYGTPNAPQAQHITLWRQYRELTGFSFVLEHCNASEVQAQIQKIHSADVF